MGTHRPDRDAVSYPTGRGRNRRTSDWYFEALDLMIAQQEQYLEHLLHVRENGGLLLDAEGHPLALDVSVVGFDGAHFATFPESLIEPCLTAALPKGVCPTCRSPWRRIVKKGTAEPTPENPNPVRPYTADGFFPTNGAVSSTTLHKSRTYQTKGWVQTCDCPEHDQVPAVALDIFGGAGTVGLVADRLGHDAVLIELNPAYADMTRDRIVADAGLFADVEVVNHV